ncbi:hypothetical protein Q4540_16400 [Pseudoalteromonas carrageenovora]|uniref:hypothetical protein n=1 Tax=Pseudoalteromonas carrageenovora TaxID=227 RepID=UPI0026E142CC|nr:hypothetical protein [Pseudoalteromonas carrageenovora]MDO6637822.1 hypothetical protein [Pseudoalteromonas carrageenovora]MDO6650078.1 hypothetical protein [Pseudoalteromonas carrageenovora]
MKDLEVGCALLIDLVPVFSLLLAVFALCVAYWQIKVGRSSTASAQAHSIYQQYLLMCMENPVLASGKYEPQSDNDEQYAKYTWFFSSMLFAFEQVLEAKPKDEQWKETIKAQLFIHKMHLAKSSTAASNQWYLELQKLIDEVKRSH